MIRHDTTFHLWHAWDTTLVFIRDRVHQRLHISSPALASDTEPSVRQIVAALVCVGMVDLSSRMAHPDWRSFADPGKHAGSPAKRTRSGPGDDQEGDRGPEDDKGPKRPKTGSDKPGPSVSKGSTYGR